MVNNKEGLFQLNRIFTYAHDHDVDIDKISVGDALYYCIIRDTEFVTEPSKVISFYYKGVNIECDPSLGNWGIKLNTKEKS